MVAATLERVEASPTCRGCGEPPRGRHDATRYATFQPESNTFVHLGCQRRQHRERKVTLVCMRCRKERTFQPCQLKLCKSYRPAHGDYLCKACRSHDLGASGPVAFLAEAYPELDVRTPDGLRQARRQHLAAVTAAVDRDQGTGTQTRRREEGYRTFLAERPPGSPIKPRSRLQFLAGVTPAQLKRNGLPVGAPGLRGEFRMCLGGCSKVLYLDPGAVKRTKGGHGIHRDCYRAWQAGDVFRKWFTTAGNFPQARSGKRRKAVPVPLPPQQKGRQRIPESLSQQFQWLILHHALGWSWGEIATKTGYARGVLTRGVERLIKVLPDSWARVFTHNPSLARFLDDYVPVSRLPSLT
jgi:hypothetical protein